MATSGIQAEAILVLCHSFFHDAFRIQRPVKTEQIEVWKSARFVANFIIEKKAELPECSTFAITSKKVFQSFAAKFHGDKPSQKQKEMVDILRNSIFVTESLPIDNLSLDEGVFAICDTLYSRSSYSPILVSNIPKKKEQAEAFYQKKNPEAKIPFPIYSVAEAEYFLRGRFPELCADVDSRIKNG